LQGAERGALKVESLVSIAWDQRFSFQRLIGFLRRT
jgi:hypothetical protein